MVEQSCNPLRGVRGLDRSGDVQPSGLDDAGDHLRDALVDVVELAGGLLTAVDQPALDVGEPAGVEEALEQVEIGRAHV